MKINVCILSITGNNEALCARFQQLVDPQHQHEFITTNINAVVASRERGDSWKIEPADAFVFATYTDYFQFPPQMPKFFSFFPKELLKDKPIAALNAHGGNAGQVGNYFAREFQGMRYIGFFQAKFCSNYYPPLYPKTDDEVYAISDTFIPDLKAFAAKCAHLFANPGEIEPARLTCGQKTTLALTPKFSTNFRHRIMRKSPFVVKEQMCIGCQACYLNCPSNCFVMKDGKAVVRDSSPCICCFSCIYNCPVHAISDEAGKLDHFVQYHFHEYQIGKKTGMQPKKELYAGWKAKTE